MAIALRSDVPQTDGSGGSFSINAPDDLQEGDRLFIVVAEHSFGDTIAVTTGVWETISHFDASDTGQMQAVFTKIAGADEPSSYTVTDSDSGAFVNIFSFAAYSTAGGTVEYYNEDFGTDTAGPTLVTDSITTVNPWDLVVSCWSQDQSAAGDYVASSPAALVELADDWEAGNQVGNGIFTEYRVAAGSGDHTVTQNGGTSSRSACWTIFALHEELEQFVRTHLRHIYISNPTGSNATVTLSINSDGADAHIFERIIPAGTELGTRRPIEVTLTSGETIRGYASVSGVVLILDGIEEAI